MGVCAAYYGVGVTDMKEKRQGGRVRATPPVRKARGAYLALCQRYQQTHSSSCKLMGDFNEGNGHQIREWYKDLFSDDLKELAEEAKHAITISI